MFPPLIERIEQPVIIEPQEEHYYRQNYWTDIYSGEDLEECLDKSFRLSTVLECMTSNCVERE